jgi:predicted AAA+ superfamily ATPase
MMEVNILIFERKIYNKLLEWKSCDGAEALLIEGARRVGKSTIVQEFARNEYESYILIDFARTSEDVKGYFVRFNNDLDTLFMMLQNVYGVALKERKSLIIFDEVQRFPTAREMIKYLVADRRYDYIETGSLISIKDSVKDIVIPSEERSVKMYPMDFEEFCIALGNKPIVSYIRECFSKNVPLERGLHDIAMQ